jgi:hypothetical protein
MEDGTAAGVPGSGGGAPIPSLAWPPEPMGDPASGDEDSLLGSGGPKAGKDKSAGGGGGGSGGVSQDSIERRAAALAALKVICESVVLAPHLEALLAGLDAQVPLQGVFFCPVRPPLPTPKILFFPSRGTLNIMVHLLCFCFTPVYRPFSPPPPPPPPRQGRRGGGGGG